MKLEIPHKLGRGLARQRLADGLDRLSDEYRGSVAPAGHRWAGDRLSFTVDAMGCRASGTATVEDDRILVTVDVPLGLRMFSGLAREYLLREGTKFFASAGLAAAA